MKTLQHGGGMIWFAVADRRDGRRRSRLRRRANARTMRIVNENWDARAEATRRRDCKACQLGSKTSANGELNAVRAYESIGALSCPSRGFVAITVLSSLLATTANVTGT